MKHSLTFIASALLAGFITSPRTEAASFADEVTRLATPLVDASGLTPTRSVGLVVMVVTDSGTRTFGFGARRAGAPPSPYGDTFLQVCSTYKTINEMLLPAPTA